MNSILKNIFGILILLIIVFITVGVLFNNLTKKSFYEESGVIKVQGISDKVNIYKSEFGVSQIFAENESDMYFSLGYVHAQDRLWQMDLIRRVAEGRLSEILGKEVLDYDILFRTIGINKFSVKQYEKLSLKSKSILSAYCSGVNFFIEQNSKQLPLEFDILNYKPEQWKPEHSVMLIRLMGWELNLSWYSDVMFGEIVKKFGLEKAKDFFPDYPEDAPFVITNETDKVKSDTSKPNVNSTRKTSSIELYQNQIEKNYSSVYELGKNYFNLSKNYRRYFGLEGIHVGSNAWVIAGNKTETKKPLLANDPHLALLVPSKWYEVSLYDNKKKYSVCGFSMPGVPGIAIGHNDIISWGLTNLMCDDSDFFILEKDSADRNKYIFKNEVLSLDSSIENIKIKDAPDDYIFTTFSTKLGPVVSNLEKTGFTNNQKFRTQSSEEILTFKWTGFEFSDELETFYKINNASNWKDFKEALKTFGTPALNFVYADTIGNIAYHSAGLIPVRENFTDESYANFPSNGESNWSGFIPFAELPNSINPKNGYIVTANNKPQKNYKYYISNLYEPHYRAERIEELIMSNSIVTEDEVKLMQRDVYSIQANDFCKYLFDAFGDSANLTSDVKNYLDLLRQWDFEFKTNSVASTLFAQFEIELYKNFYKDALGAELFENYLFLKNIPVRNTAKLFKLKSSLLFENNFAKEQIIRKSFYDAVSDLISRYGSDFNKWEWGEVHKVNMKHPLGVVPSLSSMLNIGPFKISGNGTTINNLEYSFSAALNTGEFESYLGPSMRMIIDLSNAKRYLSIIPTGQSGQPLHSNYEDQARLWLNGDYKKVSTDFDDLKIENLKLLSLEPSE
ncbi:MAG: penicillin acylase family protein [Bacteroidota bacterium]|nr:penicillin acylase family protein [Bacteroidota bacterium]